MKKLLVTVLLAGLALIWGCASDIILEPEAPLIGDYEGIYRVTTDFGSAAENVDSSYVLVTFTTQTYIMRIDTARIDTANQFCFCRVDGEYALTEGVRLREKHSLPDGEANCTSCNETHNPVGTFQRNNSGGMLILKNLAGTTFKEMELRRRLIPDTLP
ncbi:MAG: hypothetical protein ABIE70_04990 [bacterium]